MSLPRPSRKGMHRTECHQRRTALFSALLVKLLREKWPQSPQTLSQPLVNIVKMMKEDGGSGGRETPQQILTQLLAR